MPSTTVACFGIGTSSTGPIAMIRPFSTSTVCASTIESSDMGNTLTLTKATGAAVTGAARNKAKMMRAERMIILVSRQVSFRNDS